MHKARKISILAEDMKKNFEEAKVGSVLFKVNKLKHKADSG